MSTFTPVGHTRLQTASAAPELLDFAPAAFDMRAEVLAGLAKPQKTLPCKFFYDERGSKLFDAICELPEYYPTRTELSILHAHGEQITQALGPRTLLVEYGSGSSAKTRVLLDQLQDAAGYVPIDISREHLMQAARGLADRYPHLAIRPVCADYTRPFQLPTFAGDEFRNVVAFFPGSTIGNFEPAEALAFMRSMRATCGRGSGLLIGVDLKKHPSVLHAAYNDAAGVTAAFNLNILQHINHNLDSDFSIDDFAHYAFYNPLLGRMEMHLVSRRAQTVRLGEQQSVHFDDGESIHTESCYKYTIDSFRRLAASAGYRRERVWTDAARSFSMQYFVSAD